LFNTVANPIKLFSLFSDFGCYAGSFYPKLFFIITNMQA
jgi:hypothetical protein